VEVPNTSYTVLVAKTTEDGLDVAGLARPDDVQAPLATLNGWGIRGEGFRPGELCGLNGQNVPFAATAAERHASGDPRLSIEERYPTHADYVGRVTMAAMDLESSGYVLPGDVQEIVGAATAAPVP
jgi:Alpha/beta hydrolase domain